MTQCPHLDGPQASSVHTEVISHPSDIFSPNHALTGLFNSETRGKGLGGLFYTSSLSPPSIPSNNTSQSFLQVHPPQPQQLLTFATQCLNKMYHTSPNILQRLFDKGTLTTQSFNHGLDKCCSHFGHFPCREESRNFLNSNRTTRANTQWENVQGEDG